LEVKKGEYLTMLVNNGRAPRFSGLIRVMQRPGWCSLWRSTAAAELAQQRTMRGRRREGDGVKVKKNPLDLFIREKMNSKLQVQKSRRHDHYLNNKDASFFGMDD
jgi:hypothetical protein